MLIRNTIIIQNEAELKYIKENSIKFKNYLKIIWFPTNFSGNKIKGFLNADNFLKKKYKINCDTEYDYKLNNFFYKIDFSIKKHLNIFPNYINVFQNSRHEFKTFFDYYYNEFAKIEYLFRRYNLKNIFIFKKKEKLFAYNLNYIFTLYKNKKIRIFHINKKLNNKSNIEFFTDSILIPPFIRYSYKLTDRLKSKIKNYIINKLFSDGKKVLIIDGNRYLLNSLKKIKNLNLNFENIQNFYLNEKNLKVSKKMNLKIKEEILKEMNSLKFLNKAGKIDVNKFFFDFIVNFYPKLFNTTLNIYNLVRKLDEKNNYYAAISQNEIFHSKIIHDYFINNGKKFLTLSHGGTIGHYKNNPRVSFYDLKTNKLSYYQSFSEEIKKEMKKLIYKNYKKKEFNLINIPHISLTELKNKYKFKKITNQKKNILYFASPLNSQVDSKFGIHNEFKILNLRKIFFSKIKDFNINLRLGYSSKINDMYAEYVKNNFKNINIVSNEIPLYKALENADIIVCESNSTTIIESLITKKPIICFQKTYPNFTKQSLRHLEKRILFLNTTKQIISFINNFDSMHLKQLNKKNINNNFLEKFYNYKNLKNSIFIKNIKKFLVKN